MTVHPPVLALRGVTKSFGSALALDGVDLEVGRGEVHGLLGENGSGKSTLIKVLNGFHVPDAGTLTMNGEEVGLPLAPGRFGALGLSFVHQDLGLIPDLTVLENLRMVALSREARWRISWRAERRRAEDVFAAFGLEGLDPDLPVARLGATDRALLAIVRAVVELRAVAREGRPGLLVLDEPTVFLPREGVERLFALVRDVVADGTSVLFVSHDIDEVLELTDHVTVLRDGRVSGTAVTSDVDATGLVELIIGRRLAAARAPSPAADDAPDLAARPTAAIVRRAAGGRVLDVSFELFEGEILGVTGLMGSGFEELPYLLFGAVPAVRGTLQDGEAERRLAAMSPRRALESGIALVPADRPRDGGVGELTVGDNMMLGVLGAHRPGLLRHGALRTRAVEMAEEFDVRPADPGRVFSSLSGGNQQKAVLAKWLETSPRILLLHEPTQGVDVGAREQIFAVLRRAVENGTSIVCASSDAEQLAQLCDRVLVIARGRVSSELSGEALTRERIAEETYNSVTLAEAEGVIEEAV